METSIMFGRLSAHYAASWRKCHAKLKKRNFFAPHHYCDEFREAVHNHLKQLESLDFEMRKSYPSGIRGCSQSFQQEAQEGQMLDACLRNIWEDSGKWAAISSATSKTLGIARGRAAR
jgi:hypothetical protein